MSRIKQYIPTLAAILLVTIGILLSIYQKENTLIQHRKNYIDALIDNKEI